MLEATGRLGEASGKPARNESTGGSARNNAARRGLGNVAVAVAGRGEQGDRHETIYYFQAYDDDDTAQTGGRRNRSHSQLSPLCKYLQVHVRRNDRTFAVHLLDGIATWKEAT